ncbi:MAG: hypothetical protein ABSE25_04110 [Syntrophorhabdales bacterium]
MKVGLPTEPQGVSDGKTARQKSMEKAAEGFESFFIFSMLKEMGKTAHFGQKSYAEETEMSIFYEKVADYLAARGIGIKEVILKYLTNKG